MGCRLFIGNLSSETTKEKLREAFEVEGCTVDEVAILTSPDTGCSIGVGLVIMASEMEAQLVIAALHGILLDGRNLIVHKAYQRAGFGGGNPDEN